MKIKSFLLYKYTTVLKEICGKKTDHRECAFHLYIQQYPVFLPRVCVQAAVSYNSQFTVKSNPYECVYECECCRHCWLLIARKCLFQYSALAITSPFHLSLSIRNEFKFLGNKKKMSCWKTAGLILHTTIVKNTDICVRVSPCVCVYVCVCLYVYVQHNATLITFFFYTINY